MISNLRHIFFPSREEKLQQVNHMLQEWDNHIGHCITCEHITPPINSGMTEDYGECLKGMEFFPSRVCDLVTVDCPNYVEKKNVRIMLEGLAHVIEQNKEEESNE